MQIRISELVEELADPTTEVTDVESSLMCFRTILAVQVEREFISQRVLPSSDVVCAWVDGLTARGADIRRRLLEHALSLPHCDRRHPRPSRLS
jgi:hypothetical protein